MTTLHCAIKQQYLDLIKQGTKNTEYRDMSPYWVRKLCVLPANANLDDYRSQLIAGTVKPKFVPYTHITFHCGTDTLTLPITEIKTYRGHKLFAIALDNKKSPTKKEQP